MLVDHQAPRELPGPRRASLTKHKRKDEIIKTFKRAATENQIPSAGPLEQGTQIPTTPALTAALPSFPHPDPSIPESRSLDKQCPTLWASLLQLNSDAHEPFHSSGRTQQDGYTCKNVY